MVEERAWSYLGHNLKRPEAPPTRVKLARTRIKKRETEEESVEGNGEFDCKMGFEDAPNVARNNGKKEEQLEDTT